MERTAKNKAGLTVYMPPAAIRRRSNKWKTFQEEEWQLAKNQKIQELLISLFLPQPEVLLFLHVGIRSNHFAQSKTESQIQETQKYNLWLSHVSRNIQDFICNVATARGDCSLLLSGKGAEVQSLSVCPTSVCSWSLFGAILTNLVTIYWQS